MPDGSMIMDAPVFTKDDIKLAISIPNGKLESPLASQNGQTQKLEQYYDACLNLPSRLDPNRQNTAGRRLAHFLTEKGYVDQIKLWNKSWGFGYVSNEKAIYISEIEMPKDRYDYFVFRLGTAR